MNKLIKKTVIALGLALVALVVLKQCGSTDSQGRDSPTHESPPLASLGGSPFSPPISPDPAVTDHNRRSHDSLQVLLELSQKIEKLIKHNESTLAATRATDGKLSLIITGVLLLGISYIGMKFWKGFAAGSIVGHRRIVEEPETYSPRPSKPSFDIEKTVQSVLGRAKKDMELSQVNSQRQLDALRSMVAQVEGALLSSRKIEKVEQELGAERDKLRKLESELSVARADLESERTRGVVTINAKEREFAELRRSYASLLPKAESAEYEQLLAGLLVGFESGSESAKACIACLAIARAASTSGVDEQTLLSSIRQFSECYAGWRREAGIGSTVICEELGLWAAFLNQLPGSKYDIRVPSPGVPFDTRIMSSESSISKVSEVHSWCVMNSKGGVFAQAKVG
jgi:hypothetical protein